MTFVYIALMSALALFVLLLFASFYYIERGDVGAALACFFGSVLFGAVACNLILRIGF